MKIEKILTGKKITTINIRFKELNEVYNTKIIEFNKLRDKYQEADFWFGLENNKMPIQICSICRFLISLLPEQINYLIKSKIITVNDAVEWTNSKTLSLKLIPDKILFVNFLKKACDNNIINFKVPWKVSTEIEKTLPEMLIEYFWWNCPIDSVKEIFTLVFGWDIQNNQHSDPIDIIEITNKLHISVGFVDRVYKAIRDGIIFPSFSILYSIFGSKAHSLLPQSISKFYYSAPYDYVWYFTITKNEAQRMGKEVQKYPPKIEYAEKFKNELIENVDFNNIIVNDKIFLCKTRDKTINNVISELGFSDLLNFILFADENKIRDEVKNIDIQNDILEILEFYRFVYCKIGNKKRFETILKSSKTQNENKTQTIAHQKIDDLDLSVRSYNILRRNGITTIDQLIRLTKKDLQQLKDFGTTCVKEIETKLSSFGLTLKK